MVKELKIDKSGLVVGITPTSSATSRSFDQRWFNLEQEALYQKSKELKLARKEEERAIMELRKIRSELVQFHEDVFFSKVYSKKEKDAMRMAIATEIVEIDYLLGKEK